jgi:hypothetical protein
LTLPGTISAEVVRIPFRGNEILAVDNDGKPNVILKPVIDGLGIDYSTQIRKLKAKSWACVGTMPTQLPGDSQTREHVIVDVRTFLMLLATIDENRVSASARDILIAYQNEVADVIEAYWTKGGSVNPRADAGQLDDLTEKIEQRKADLRAAAAKRDLGVIDAMGVNAPPEFKHKLVVHTWAIYKGEKPEIAAEDRLLMVQPYLVERGISKADIASIGSVFGKRVKSAYIGEYNREPEEVPALLNGRERSVKGYYERDRFLFDAVFEEHYSHLVGPQQLELGAA